MGGGGGERKGLEAALKMKKEEKPRWAERDKERETKQSRDALTETDDGKGKRSQLCCVQLRHAFRCRG